MTQLRSVYLDVEVGILIDSKQDHSAKHRSRSMLAVAAAVIVSVSLVSFAALYEYYIQPYTQPKITVVIGSKTESMAGDFIQAVGVGSRTSYFFTPEFNVTTQIHQNDNPASLFSIRFLRGEITTDSIGAGPSPISIYSSMFVWINGSLASSLHPTSITLKMNDYGLNNTNFYAEFAGNGSNIGQLAGLNNSNTSYDYGSDWYFYGDGAAEGTITLLNLYPEQPLSNSNNAHLYHFGMMVELIWILWTPSNSTTGLDHVLHIQATMNGLPKPVPIYSAVYFNDTGGW